MWSTTKQGEAASSKLVLRLTRFDPVTSHRKSTRVTRHRSPATIKHSVREEEREREEVCKHLDEAPTQEASICVHTHSQHALSRQAQTRESHLTEDHGYWGPHPVTSSSLTCDCRQIPSRSITAPASGIQLTPEGWHAHETQTVPLLHWTTLHRQRFLSSIAGYLGDFLQN